MNSYSAGKVYSAHHALAAGWGNLPERMKEAHGYLTSCTNIEGYENYFEKISENLFTVNGGDYSKVSKIQLQAAVATIEEMAYEIARQEKSSTKA
jgi:hypothetical protein